MERLEIRICERHKREVIFWCGGKQEAYIIWPNSGHALGYIIIFVQVVEFADLLFHKLLP